MYNLSPPPLLPLRNRTLRRLKRLVHHLYQPLEQLVVHVQVLQFVGAGSVTVCRCRKCYGLLVKEGGSTHSALARASRTFFACHPREMQEGGRGGLLLHLLHVVAALYALACSLHSLVHQRSLEAVSVGAQQQRCTLRHAVVLDKGRLAGGFAEGAACHVSRVTCHASHHASHVTRLQRTPLSQRTCCRGRGRMQPA